MKALPPLKVGDTFQIGCVNKDADGMPESLAGVTLRAQARSAATGALISELAIVVADQVATPGEFLITAATTAWPVGSAVIDIQATVGSVVTSSETMRLPIIEDVTHD